jgi:hypothetical protein
MLKHLITCVLSVATFSTFAVDVPDPVLTPGAVRTTNSVDVCSTPEHKISTKDVRNVPDAVKNKAYALYSVPGGNHTGYCSIARGCEVDHLISLELGGSNDIKNLWPQPYTGVWNASMKDALENRLHSMVCKNEITLTEAQHAIATDWKGAWVQYVNRGKNK